MGVMTPLTVVGIVEGGEIVAHSGTCIGLLLDLEEAGYESKLQLTTARLQALTGDA